MRGVILAGGAGSRMLPLMRDHGVKNKHLLEVGGRPMIRHAFSKLAGAGVTDVLLVTSPDGIGSLGSLLRSGAPVGCRLCYRVQEFPAGIADALLLAEDFAQDEPGPLPVVLADNLWEVPFPRAMLSPRGGRAWVALHEVDDPQNYGVATLCPTTRRIEQLCEKPAAAREGDLAVTGVYAYPADVFSLIRKLEPSARGELEITDLNRLYLRAGILEYVTLPGWWADAGTPEGLAEADRLCRERPPLF